MEPTSMLHTATALFLLTALGGLVMAGIRFIGKRNPPAWLAMAHGLLAGAGLTLLVYAALTVGVPPRAGIAAVLFVVAALGGVVLNLAYQLKDRPLPKTLTAVHASIAIVAFLLLLSTSFG